MCFRRARTAAAVAAVLLASAPAATAAPATAGYGTCSVVRTIALAGWVAGSDGRYHRVTVRKPYAISVAFPVLRFRPPAY
ncbi:hypothetical protein [Amycolatopsis plumensis]|uniref:hypothetical protein n=1 Tax=Amycolatopsis plumensis TaxID=236508 RepID=UPI00360DCDB0